MGLRKRASERCLIGVHNGPAAHQIDGDTLSFQQCGSLLTVAVPCYYQTCSSTEPRQSGAARTSSIESILFGIFQRLYAADDVRGGVARNQTRAPVERDVEERPLHEHQYAVLEFHDIHQVDKEPD